MSMISSILKDSKFKKALSGFKGLVQNISNCEKKIELLEKQRDAEMSKLLSILTNTK
jgi:hypothetical protein